MTVQGDMVPVETHEGGCLCGRIRYGFDGDPLMVAICHCRNCQRQSGSAFSIVCVVADQAYRQTGETAIFEDIGESGQSVSRHFCGNCGTPIVSIAQAIPGLTILKAGSLDQPGRWTPTVEAYCETGLPWVPQITSERHPRSNIGG